MQLVTFQTFSNGGLLQIAASNTARAQLFFEPVSSAVCYHTLVSRNVSFGAACLKLVCLVALGA